MSGPRTCLALLAAGEGSRFAASGGSGHKLFAPFRGRTVVEWAIHNAVAAEVGPVFLVTGAVDVPVSEGVELVANSRWREGMATSISAAVGAAQAAGHTAVVVGLGDQPLVPSEAWRRVATSPGPIAVATYDGERGHPVRIGVEVWPLLPTLGDVGARRIMREHPDLVVEVPCEGRSADIDTVEDLKQWS